MRRPSITDYIGTLENPIGVFRTLGDVAVRRNLYGDINLCAGNSAAIFTYPADENGDAEGDGELRFLKCYIRPNPHLRTIYEYVERRRPAILTGARLLPDELYVHSLVAGAGWWVDLVEGRWIEGQILAIATEQAAQNRDKERLRELADAFDALCAELLDEEWAHGDLKPENIVVTTGGRPEHRRMVLIDCDAMWLPALAGERAAELGTPAYRHPGRTAAHFSKRIDDYPAMLISSSLHALALSPELYERYNTTDNLILSPAEIVRGDSGAWSEMMRLFAEAGMAREYRMTEELAAPFPDGSEAGRFFSAAVPPPAFGELRAFVERGGWGFVDEAGQVAEPPFWDDVLEFKNGRTKVRLAGHWHIFEKKTPG